MTPELHREIGSLQAKVDILLERSAKKELSDEKRDERITQLEHDKTRITAYAAVVSAAVGFAWTVAAKFVGPSS